jgi:hypothetical protein
MKNSEKGKRNGTISAFIERHYHAGTRLVVALVLVLTVASVVAAQVPILHIYLPIILKTFSGGQVSDASGSGAAPEQVNLSADTGSSDSSGVPAAQQPPLDCENPSGHGEKIKCKSKDLIDETCKTVDLMSQDDLGILTLAQRDEMNKTCTFATEMVEATDPAEFQTFGMKRSAEGVAEYVVKDDPENDGNDDGICQLKKGGPKKQNCKEEEGCKPKKYTEWCAEVSDDNIGDDDGKCEWQEAPLGTDGKSYLEPCVPLSDVEAIDSQEENFNEEKLVAVEKALDDDIEAMKAANTQLAADLEELRMLRATSAETFSGYDPKQCLGLMYVDDFKSSERTFTYIALDIAMTIEATLTGIHDQCDSASNQDVLGNNGSVVCVATATAKGIAYLLWETGELIDDTFTAVRLDNAVQCLETVAKKLDGIKDGVDKANAKLDKMLRVDLQVTELKEKSEFLVGATEGGKPASGVEFTSVKVADSSISFTDVTYNTTVTEVGPGMYRVVIDLPKEAKNAKIFAFQVKHYTTVDGEGMDLFGFTHFHRGTQ